MRVSMSADTANSERLGRRVWRLRGLGELVPAMLGLIWLVFAC